MNIMGMTKEGPESTIRDASRRFHAPLPVSANTLIQIPAIAVIEAPINTGENTWEPIDISPADAARAMSVASTSTGVVIQIRRRVERSASSISSRDVISGYNELSSHLFFPLSHHT
ncbi:hypothetical protein [Gordonia malaquae]